MPVGHLSVWKCNVFAVFDHKFVDNHVSERDSAPS